MRKSRFSEEQIIFVLRQAEAGVPVAELIRKYGISQQTFYRWPHPGGQRGASQAERPHRRRVRRAGGCLMALARRKRADLTIAIDRPESSWARIAR